MSKYRNDARITIESLEKDCEEYRNHAALLQSRLAHQLTALKTKLVKWGDDLGEEPVRSHTLDWHYWENTRQAYKNVIRLLERELDDPTPPTET